MYNHPNINQLFSELESVDENVRMNALFQLKILGNPTALEHFIRVMERTTETRAIRLSAIEGLSIMRDARAVQPMLKILKDTNEEVTFRNQVCLFLRDFSRESIVEVAPEILQNEDDPLCPNIILYLGNIGSEKAKDLLFELLQSKKDDWVYFVAVALGETGSQKAKEELIQLYSTARTESLKFALAVALGKLGDNSVVPYLMEEALNWHDHDRRWEATQTLAYLKATRALELFIEGLDDYQKDIRNNSVIALSKIGDKRAVEPLLARLSIEADQEIIENIIGVLSSFGEKRAIEPIRNFIAKIGDYQSEDDRIGNGLTGHTALYKLGVEESLAEIIKVLNNPEKGWRIAALFALQSFGKNKQVLQAIIGMLHDENWDVKIDAAKVVARIGDTEAIPALEQLYQEYKEGNFYVRNAAEDALKQLRGSGSQPTLGMMHQASDKPSGCLP